MKLNGGQWEVKQRPVRPNIASGRLHLRDCMGIGAATVPDMTPLITLRTYLPQATYFSPDGRMHTISMTKGFIMEHLPGTGGERFDDEQVGGIGEVRN